MFFFWVKECFYLWINNVVNMLRGKVLCNCEGYVVYEVDNKCFLFKCEKDCRCGGFLRLVYLLFDK